MPVLPIPMIIALVLLAFLVQRLLTRKSHPTLLALIAACATQSAIIALVQYYGMTQIRFVQPLFATVIAPIAWVAFLQAAGHTDKPQRLWPHSAGLLAAVACLFLKPMLLDILIPLSFIGYGLAILIRLMRGEETLPHSSLESGAMPLVAWRIIAISLLASAVCDAFISYSLSLGATGNVFWLPSLVSSLSLLSLGALSLTSAIESHRDVESTTNFISPEDIERDTAIITRLDDYIREQKPYLDPDLTLARLSRKLLVPTKQLSGAINRVKGENVSKFINNLRIEEACRKLSQKQSITVAMLDSGFNTKSNFNREFLRIKNMSPRDWQISLLK